MHLPMKASYAVRIVLGSLVTLGVVGESTARQAAPGRHHPPAVVVEGASGRSFTGTIDSRTDDTRLWLRWRHGTISILRPIRWERVVGGEYEGRRLPGDEFRQAVVGPDGLVFAREEAVAPRSGKFHLRSLRSATSHVAESGRSAPTSTAITTGEPGLGKGGAEYLVSKEVVAIGADQWASR